MVFDRTMNQAKLEIEIWQSLNTQWKTTDFSNRPENSQKSPNFGQIKAYAYATPT